MEYKALKGVKDILPPESLIWQEIEKIFAEIVTRYGYLPIRVPLMEETTLFTRSVGDTTDIVEKQMYTFLDRGQRSISLRPEATASVVRAYIENGLYKTEHTVKYYYAGPMFRNERPQAGRLRQFHQLGVEVIGTSDPLMDAEVMAMATHVLGAVGLQEGLVLKVNSLGTNEDKKRYSNALKETLQAHIPALCETCKGRMERNVFRILDCKDEACKKVRASLPTSSEFLSQESKDQFAQVLEGLDMLHIAYVRDPYLVRGLDYYTRTTFEISHAQLGAQDALGAGGRYDGLVHELGGPQKGAVGFALGMERLVLALGQTMAAPGLVKPSVYIAHFGGDTTKAAFLLCGQLRKAGATVFFDAEPRAIKKQFADANKLRVQYVITLGENEIKAGVYALKDMVTGSQENVTELQMKERIGLV